VIRFGSFQILDLLLSEPISDVGSHMDTGHLVRVSDLGLVLLGLRRIGSCGSSQIIAKLQLNRLYHFIQSLKAKELPGPSSDEVHSFWYEIWSLNLPSRIKMIWWRVCVKAIPTRGQWHGEYLGLMQGVRCVVNLMRRTVCIWEFSGIEEKMWGDCVSITFGSAPSTQKPVSCLVRGSVGDYVSNMECKQRLCVW